MRRLQKSFMILAILVCMSLVCVILLLPGTGREPEAEDPDSAWTEVSEDTERLQRPMGKGVGDKTEYEATSIYKFDERVRALLSNGEFSELDSWLASLQDRYTDNTSDDAQYAESTDEHIACLRSDLALALTLEDVETDSNLLHEFKSAEVLAAIVAYSSASLKLDAFIDQDSDMLPGVPTDDRHQTALREVDLTDETRLDLLEKLNTRRTAGNGFNDVRIFTFHAFSRDCKVTIVHQQSLGYCPYSMEITNGASIFTVKEIKELRTAALSTGTAFSADDLMAMRPETLPAEEEKTGRRVDIPIPNDFVIPPDDFPLE